MLEKLGSIESRYEELERLMGEYAEDYQKVVELAKERSDLEVIVTKSRDYRTVMQQIDEARVLQNGEDSEMHDLANAELAELLPRSEKLEKELKSLLAPKDPRDDRNVLIEIRAGAGGDEAGLFVADLYRMITLYAERRRWTVEIMSESPSGIGGYKEISFTVKGKGAYSKLKYESGVHRVQRIPSTESSGRIHTSTVTVAVLAEVEDVDLQIPDSELRIDVYRSAGAGGQNVQKNSTAVRLTHLPTGIVITCQDERSQLQNKMRAMTILRARLYDLEMAKRQQEQEDSRRSQVGTGERSEKIRTYNYPQNRVTDHRINLSSYNLPAVMDGDLDQFIDEISIRDESERLSMGEEDDE